MDIVFQYAGALPHDSRQAKNYLDNNFPGLLIGRQGPT